MIKIGPYTLHSIETGEFALDGGAMFGIIPKPLWEKTNPADPENRIEMRLRCLLIQGAGKNILVDCGIGTKWAEKYQKIYKINHVRWSLDRELAQKGLKREDITHVILTHLHFDHAGGMTYRERPDGELLPTFPNAEVFVQRRNWELGWHPSEKDQASYLTENYGIYKDGGLMGRKLTLIDTPSIEPTGRMTYTGPESREDQIFPGISVQVSNGHTLGMQIVKIRDEKETLIYGADLIPTATHVRLPFIMGYDCFPMFILEEKRKLLSRLVEEKGSIFYEHCPRFAATRITRSANGKDFEAGEALHF